MNHLYDLSSFYTVESLFEQIDEDYIVSENNKPIILTLLDEYFRMKENDAPSTISGKWTEISKLLDSLNIKVKQWKNLSLGKPVNLLAKTKVKAVVVNFLPDSSNSK